MMDGWKNICVALALSAGSAHASTNFYAQATAAETNVFLGQVFNLNVIVKADEKPEAPKLGALAEFNVTLLDDGKPTSEANTWLYRYALRAKQEGELTIPALRFGTVSSEAVTIQAKKPEATDRMALEQMLSKQSVYVGEPVLLTTTWDSTYPFGAIKAVDFNFPVLNDPRFQLLELYEPNKESSANTTGLPVHGTRVLASRKSYKVEETDHQSLSFSKILIPKKSGRILIPPATLLCAAEQEKELNNKNRRSAFQYPAYFDNTFFDQNVTGGNWTRIYTESKPLVLDVVPLPMADRPALFNGMVGDYTISASAEPAEVRVGEPVTLTVTITAADFMENIFFEPLRYQPLLVNRFEIPADRSLPQRQGKSKIYTQTIRPLSTNIDAVPPIQLSFFNPASNAYFTVKTEPIALKVIPAEEIGMFGGGTMQNRLRSAEGGIRHNYEGLDMLQNRRLPMFGWANPIAVPAILLLPPLAVGLIALISLFGEKRHHIHRTAKAARAFKIFRKNAAHIIHGHSMKSEIYSDLDQVLRAYLGDRLHLTPGALSFREAEQLLAEEGADIQTLEELKSLFARCEAYRFTHGYDEKADAKLIVRNAIHTVKTLERKLK